MATGLAVVEERTGKEDIACALSKNRGEKTTWGPTFKRQKTKGTS